MNLTEYPRMKYDLVIFDLDGTLLDTLDDLRDSLNTALGRSGLPERTTAEVRRFVGNGMKRLVERGVPEGTSAEIVDRVLQDFTAHYKLHCTDKTRPYPGIPELLRRLRASGCRTAVVSNKDDFAVRALCDDHFPGLFDLSVGCRAGIRRKPAPDSVLEVLSRLGASAASAVYVGDSEVDVETARNAQLPLIAVSWGFRDAEELIRLGANPVDSAEALLELLLNP